MIKYFKPFTLFLIFAACSNTSSKKGTEITQHQAENEKTIIADGSNISTRFKPPSGYIRIKSDINSFGSYLQALPLKESAAVVKHYNGTIKQNKNAYCAVVDLPIGNKNLHQCADAIIRLRAEYLYAKKDYHRIHFNFTNGFRVDYISWMEGKRISIKGNKTWWEQKRSPSNTYDTFWNYLETIFMYAGTLSLANETESRELKDMQIGDFFIQGGSPGHAVIVVEMAQHQQTGEKLFMLAQSYMPAQDLQILVNPNNPSINPWYSLEIENQLNTPEWTFNANNLKYFTN